MRISFDSIDVPLGVGKCPAHYEYSSITGEICDIYQFGFLEIEASYIYFLCSKVEFLKVLEWHTRAGVYI